MLKKIKTDRQFAIISTLIITFIIFAPFFIQKLLTNFITFHLAGDNFYLCYPGFLKLSQYIPNSIGGVDTGTFNGATEFFLRPNLPNMYLPLAIFSWLTRFIPAKISYLLFYVLHFGIAIYYAQKLSIKFFNINRWFALLFALAYSRIILCEHVYLSFFIIASLVSILLYSGLSSLNNTKASKFILYALPYVLAFTSGYSTVSVALVVFCVLFTMLYAMYYFENGKERIIALIRAIISPAIATFVCLIYYLQVFNYVKSVVGNATLTFFDTVAYTVLDFNTLLNIFTDSFFGGTQMEQANLMTLGFVWIMVIIWLMKYRLLSKANKYEKSLIIFSIGSNVFLLLCAFGASTPLALWFYSFVPILGSMHIPMRYMMISMPMLFLSFCILLKYMPDITGKKTYKYISVIAIISTFIMLIMTLYIDLKYINYNQAAIELLLVGVAGYFIYMFGISNKTIIVFCIIVIFPATNIFYWGNEININKLEVEGRSVVHNERYSDQLDIFISNLEPKDRYSFVAYDSYVYLPDFIPGNYEWYKQSEYNLSNYLGYEMHLCVPSDYHENNYLFNNPDWKYIINTRGDFIVLDDVSIQENPELFNTIVDWDNSNTYIDGVRRICKLKKFIPEYYTHAEYVIDNDYVLDNGYFYTHDLEKSALLDFATDDATYYRASINAGRETSLAFLLYPNRYYHYYVDGVEINPVIEDMKVYIPIDSGEHIIEVKYENIYNSISYVVFGTFYILVIIVGIKEVLCLFIKRRKENESSNIGGRIRNKN